MCSTAERKPLRKKCKVISVREVQKKRLRSTCDCAYHKAGHIVTPAVKYVPCILQRHSRRIFHESLNCKRRKLGTLLKIELKRREVWQYWAVCNNAVVFIGLVDCLMTQCRLWMSAHGLFFRIWPFPRSADVPPPHCIGIYQLSLQKRPVLVY